MCQNIRYHGIPLLLAMLILPALGAFTSPLAAQVVFHVDTIFDTVDVNPGDGVALDANGETSLRAAVMETNALIALGNTGPFEIHLSLNPVPGAQVEYQLDIPADPAAPGYDPDSAAWDDLDLNGPPAGQPPVQVTVQGLGSVLQDPFATPNFPLQCWHGTPPNPAARPVAVVRWPDPPPPPLPDERDRIFDARNVVLTIHEVELVNGRATSAGAASGGAIRAADADVQLRDSILHSHSAGTRGGAIDLHSLTVPSNLTVERSRICSCAAQENGGAIAVDGLAPELHLLDDTTIQANQSNALGGGVSLGAGNGFIFDTTISENVAFVGGGAYLRGVSNVERSLISGNSAIEAVLPPDGPLGATAGGGLYVDGNVTMIDSNVQLNIADRGSLDDRGGGVAVSANGTLTAERCSILDNEAGFPFVGTGWGGGLFSIGTVTLTNSTISGNDAGLLGGGVFINGGTADFSHATIAWNRLWQFAPATGSGLAVAGGTVNVRSTLIGDNEVQDPSQPPVAWISGGNCAFNVMLGPNTDYNLDSDGTCVGGAFPPIGFGANSFIAPTGINVSRTPCNVTEVHELQSGSQAIDNADPNCQDAQGAPVIDDQCNNSRVSPCDIGAHELASQPGLCAPGAINEPEPCGSDINGGCNSTPPTYTATTCGVTICGTAWADASVRDTDWYTIDLPDADGDGLAELSADLSTDLPIVLFFLNDDCNNVQVLASATADVGMPAQLTACLAAPATYRIFVATGDPNGGIFDGFPCGTANEYTLGISCAEPCTTPPPLNDDCAGAVPIAAGDTAIDNLNATDSNIPIDPLCGTGAASDVWFSYTATVSGDLLISTCNQVNFDSWIAAYRGCCGSLSPLGCNGGSAACGQTARLLVQVFEGEEILIRVGGNNGAQGSGTLTLTEIPENCRAGFGGGMITVIQLLQVLSGWGSCPSPCPPHCLGDFNRDCQINVLDLLHVLSGWGACPPAPDHYQHDAGNNTHAVGLNTGGLVIWLQRYDVGGGGTEAIGAIQTAFGLPSAPGNAGIVAGDQVGIAVYADTGNGPADTPIWFGYDAVLGCGIDTGQPETFALPSPVTVNGSFYVAAWVANTNSLHPAPLDSTVSGHGPDVWIAGDPNQSMTWDPATGLSSLQLPPVRVDQVTTPGVWLLRAAGLE